MPCPGSPSAAGEGRILLLSTGKAGGSMMSAAVRHYTEACGLPPDRLFGVGTARHGYEDRNPLIPMIGAGHPVPDEGGLEAARRTLAAAAEAGPDDIAVVLISGGGSANWIAPAGRMSLAEKQALNKALLRSGAHIGEINCVRKHLSRIKGGRLAARIGAGRIHAFAISDVPGDDPSTIASGPTVPDPTNKRRRGDPREIPHRRSGECGCRALRSGRGDAEARRSLFHRTDFTIFVRPRDALEAAEAFARRSGYEVVSLGPDVEGEAATWRPSMRGWRSS